MDSPVISLSLDPIYSWHWKELGEGRGMQNCLYELIWDARKVRYGERFPSTEREMGATNGKPSSSRSVVEGPGRVDYKEKDTYGPKPRALDMV